MSDLTTLYRFVSVDYERTALRAGAVVPVTEPLLTREEAAYDEQVQAMVLELLTDRLEKIEKCCE